MRAAVRPFPWTSLDATTRTQIAALREARSWAAAHARLSDVARVLSELVRSEVDVTLRRAQPLADARPIDDSIGVVLARADTPEVARSALVEAERSLATAIVSRVLDRKPPVVVDASAPAAASLAGAFAAVVAAIARRVHAGVAPRVIAAGPGSALASDLARLGPDRIALTFTVLVDRDAHAGRVVVPRTFLSAAASPPWDAHSLAALGAIPLSLPIVACAVRASAADIASLQAGDAFLPGNAWRLSRSLAGTVSLAAPTSDAGVRANLGEDGRLVLSGESEPLGAAEAEMAEHQDALVTAVGEVPVVVRVEIGSAQMAARDWAELGRGDVVALGRRIGEPVVLRVGGVVVARGDLVDIEGEVGVRIVERFASEGARG